MPTSWINQNGNWAVVAAPGELEVDYMSATQTLPADDGVNPAVAGDAPCAEPVPPRASSRRRKAIQRGWIAVVLVYAGLRAIAVGRFLGPRYGLNPWHYFIVDFIAAGIEGWATGRAVCHFIDRNRDKGILYGGLAALMFVVPDIYIFVVGDHLPWYVFVIIGTVVSISATLTVVSVVKKVRSAWAARRADSSCAAGSTSTQEAPK